VRFDCCLKEFSTSVSHLEHFDNSSVRRVDRANVEIFTISLCQRVGQSGVHSKVTEGHWRSHAKVINIKVNDFKVKRSRNFPVCIPGKHY